MARFECHADVTTVAGPAGGSDAFLELGLQYCAGREVAPDLIEAHKWFNIAAMRGNGAARRYREEIAAEMSRCDIGLAQRRAREWLSRR